MSEDFINVIADNLFANTSQKELSAERIYEVAEGIAPFVITAAKKELMKKAVELPLYLDGEFLTVDYDFTESGYKVGDKVKLLVIKEE